jgi:hypothetical protein
VAGGLGPSGQPNGFFEVVEQNSKDKDCASSGRFHAA